MNTLRTSSRLGLRPIGQRLLLACVLLWTLAPLAASELRAQPAPLEGLDAFVERGMEDWRIPGLALVVVKDDRVVYARGYGVKELGRDDPVDERTLFGVASVSKAFTAAALGMLVDEGRLDWDDPVVAHIPWFELDDPYVTRNATVRDLLTHRVGVGRMTGNRLRWLPHRERAELIGRIRYLGPEQPFRRGYVYSNVMYMVAGELVEAVTGTSWDDFVRERIFLPLGMERSNTSITQLAEGENLVSPHQEIEGEVVLIPRRNFDAVGPAASINTSVAEIAAWLRLHLGEPGVYQARRLLEEETVREMHRAQVALPDAGMSGSLSAYGLGWRLGTHEGRRISTHGGAVDGMNSHMVLMPEENLGVFVTTNVFNTFLVGVANRVLDAYLGVPERDWNRRLIQAMEGQRARAEAARRAIHEAREEGTSPSVPLERFTGRYDDDLYAEAEITLEDGRLTLRLWEDETQVADLEHWHHDTFRAVWRNPAQREEFVWFTRGRDGGIDGLHIEWNLRPDLLQVGAYPSGYTRVATYTRVVDLPASSCRDPDLVR